jgi:integrase/recombinase XerD
MHRFFRRACEMRRSYAGPLGPFLDSFAEQLALRGYTRSVGRLYLRSVAKFSSWLQGEGISSDGVSPEHLAEYECRRGSIPHHELFALRQFLQKLHSDRFSPIAPVVPETAVTRIVGQYATYIERMCGLAAGTRRCYVQLARLFIDSLPSERQCDLPALQFDDVVSFLRTQSANGKSKRLRLMAVAVRSFLRFAQFEGGLPHNLASGVPQVANWAQASLPKYLSGPDVERVLDCCDRRKPAGRRDFAVLLLLVRLGLRAGEVAAITLEDIDWPRGLLTVHGKGSRSSQFPLPADVGAALAAYIKDDRPRTASRQVFFSSHAPIKPLRGQTSISSIAKAALRRAKLRPPRQGAHVFRHSLATGMLRNGVSLGEIGQILRHQSPTTTAIYAKVDERSLHSITFAWPGGER